MKKLLLLLLCIPMIEFGQDSFFKDEINKNSSKVKIKKNYSIDGCIIDPEIEKKFKKEDIPIKRGGLSNAVSLKKYCPDVGDQGRVGSCTGWATTYAAFTIVRRIECKKNKGPFSPLSTYNKIKTDAYPYQNNCKGSSPRDALNLLKNYGSPKYKDYNNICKVDTEDKKYYNRLYNFRTLNCHGELGVNNIKAALNNNEPVVIAMHVYHVPGKGNSLSPMLIAESGEWKFITAKSKTYHYNRSGGHALCIVGYDDSKFGGAFEVMNSWGDDWGDDGYFWVKYSDIHTIYYAYSLIPGNYNCDEVLVIDNNRDNYPTPNPVEPIITIYKKYNNKWWINNFRFSYSIVGGWNADYVRTGNPNKTIYSNDAVYTNRLTSYAQYGYQFRKEWWSDEEFGLVSKFNTNLGAIFKSGPTLFESSLSLDLTKDDFELGYGIMWSSFGEFSSNYSFAFNNSRNVNFSITFIPSEYGNRFMIGVGNK